MRQGLKHRFRASEQPTAVEGRLVGAFVVDNRQEFWVAKRQKIRREPHDRTF